MQIVVILYEIMIVYLDIYKKKSKRENEKKKISFKNKE